MATFHTAAGGPDLEMYVDRIETTMADPQERDPKWVERDDHAHEHTWTSDSFVWVVDYEWRDEDGELQSEGHYACKICSDTVTPKMIHLGSGYRTYVAGLTHFLIDGREVTKAEFDTAWAAAGAPPS